MRTLWFSYSTVDGLDTEEPPNSPYSITWNLGRFLRERTKENGWRFEYRNLDDTTPANIGADDIVIGHTWWDGGFMDQALNSKAKAKFILQPYSRGMVSEDYIPTVLKLFNKADHLFLITGPYWWQTMPDTPYAPLFKKATRVDMACNTELHPYCKNTWNLPGKRGFLAIGADIPAKGMDIIADLARMSGFRLGYFGNAEASRWQHVPQVRHYGGRIFSPAEIAWVCKDYDFFITIGRYDANPTTLLETSAWGLVAGCNKESGYLPGNPFIELRLDDMKFNMQQIDALQSMSEYDLRQRSEAMRQYIKDNHSWDKFCKTIWEGMQQWL